MNTLIELVRASPRTSALLMLTVVGIIAAVVMIVLFVHRKNRQAYLENRARAARTVWDIMKECTRRRSALTGNEADMFSYPFLSRHGHLLIWARVSVKKSFIIVTIECAPGASAHDHEYAEMFVAAFESETVAVGMRRDMPPPDEVQQVMSVHGRAIA